MSLTLDRAASPVHQPGRRDDADTRWWRRPHGARLVLVTGASVVGLLHSFSDSLALLRYEGVASYAGLGLLLALALFCVKVYQGRRTLSGGLGNADWWVAGALAVLALSLLGQARVSHTALSLAMRLDLLAFTPLLAAFAVLFYGVRVLTVAKSAFVLAFLGWPILLGAFEETLMGPVAGATNAVVVPVVRVLGLATVSTGNGDPVLQVAAPLGQFELALAGPCSGMGAVAACLVGLTAASSLLSGSPVRKLLWIVLAMGLAWLGNVVRVVVVVVSGRTLGESFTMDIVHPAAGVVILVAVVAMAIGQRHRLDLDWVPSLAHRAVSSPDHPLQNPAPGRPRGRQVLTRSVAAGILTAIALLFDGQQLATAGPPLPPFSGFNVDNAALPGRSVRFESDHPWSKVYFGSKSSWNRYRFDALPGSPERHTTWFDTIVAPDPRALLTHPVEECYQFHRSTVQYQTTVIIRDIQVTELVVRFPDNSTWHLVYWEWQLDQRAAERAMLFAPSDSPELGDGDRTAHSPASLRSSGRGWDPNPALSTTLLRDADVLIQSRWR